MYFTKFAMKSKSRPVQAENNASELLKPIITMGQCFALLPVNINKTKNSSAFKFKWISTKILYTSIVFTGVLATTLMCFYEILVDGISLNKAGKNIYYVL